MPLVNGKFLPLVLPRKHGRVLLDNSKRWRYRVLHGGRYGAKDWSVAGALIERAVRVKTRVLCTREVQKTVKDSIHQLLKDTIDRLGYAQYFTVLDNEIKGRNGSYFMFTGLRDLNADNIKSIEGVDICVVGEAQNLTKKSWIILDPTVRKKGSEIWIIYNDQVEADFVYQFTVVNPPENLISDRVSYLDLPEDWVSPEIKEQAERMKRDNLALYEHIWLGQPGKGGTFYPEFGDHLREMPFSIAPHECNLYGSLDYGDGQGEHSGATSFGLWHIDKNGYAHRLFTYYKRNQDAATYAREIHAAITSFSWTSGVMPKTIFADPSMFTKRRLDDTFTKSVADIFNEYGLTLTPANNDRVNGWRVMRNFFCKDETGVPRSFYWDAYNDEYEQYIPTLKAKENNPNDCEKGGEDHVGDEARYFFVAALGLATARALESKKTKGPDAIAEWNRLQRAGMVGALVA